MSLFDRTPKIRKSGHSEKASDEEVKTHFREHFADPEFDPFRSQIEQLADIAAKIHREGHKAPNTRRAGDEFQDPNYQLSVDWLKARDRIRAAQSEYESKDGRHRVLIIMASDRNENTCPSETSKTRRLAEIAQAELIKDGICEVEFLDLSQTTSVYGKHIHPCKACVSTAMPLCHWPCSCYPHHSLDQVNDWMNDIYPMWVRAHGVMIVTPVYWYQAPSALKLMMDRLVCADGGNPDPTSTQGKNPTLAKKLELDGWDFPRHLSGRFFTLVVHGDAAGVDFLTSALSNWLNDMRMIPAGQSATLGRYIDYMGSYANSHDALDKDKDIQEETRNVARSLRSAIAAQREGRLFAMTSEPEHEPRPK